MNSYANEAVCCVARSVADKFSKREDVLFPLKYFYGNFSKILSFTDDTMGNKMSRKRERRLVSFFYGSSGDAGGIIMGVGGGVKTTY